MSVLKRNRYLVGPLFSNNTETFICPISKSKQEVLNGSKIAGGWRFFNELRVLQKKDNFYSELIMSPLEFLRVSKNQSKEAFFEAEQLMHLITKKRPLFSGLDMSNSHIMGIINATPDSFYKSSQLSNADLIIEKSIKMISDGASIIDIGGESSRPGANKILVNEEKQRVIPLLMNLKNNNLGVQISLDTRNLSTMKLGIENGANIINDISGFTNDNKIKLVSKLKLPVIVMHMQKQPLNMQIKPKYSFAPVDVYKVLLKRVTQLVQMGVDRSNIVIDPGIGFGKNLHHNIEILKNITLFHSLGVPILIGASRKSLISQITISGYNEQGIYKRSISPTKRLSGSLAFAMHAYNNGIQLIRTHDVFETKQSIMCQDVIN